MGNSKGKSKQQSSNVIFNEVYQDDSSQEQNSGNIEEEDYYFCTSNDKDSTQLFLDSIDTELKVNIDSTNIYFFEAFLQRIPNLSNKVTSLHLKSSLQVKENIPILHILSLLEQITQQNVLQNLNIRFEFVYLNYDIFERIVGQVKDLTQLNNLQIRLNNNMVNNNNFLSSYANSLQQKDNLKELYILFNLRNTQISRQSFEVYLDAFNKLNSIESMTVCVENTAYPDIALDILYSVIQHKNLEYLNLDMLQYSSKKQDKSDLKNNFLRFESQKKHIYTSNLKNLSISKLTSNNSLVLFTLMSNLPKIQSVIVAITHTSYNVNDVEMRQIQEFTEEKKFLENFTITFESSLEKSSINKILSYFHHFYANSLKCSYPNNRLIDQFYTLNELDINAAFLNLVWNEVDIYCDKSFLVMADLYLANKNATIMQYIMFSKLIKPFMICNPSFIFLDLFIN